MAGENNWSKAEVRGALKAYLEILDLENKGDDFSPTAVHRRLSIGPLSGRSMGSVARRMSNISSVLSANGHEWVTRYKPSFNHVGPRVTGMILELLTELRGEAAIDMIDRVDLIKQANKLIAKGVQVKPAGTFHPKTRLQTVTIFVRNAEVVAWVLNEAKGICEACKLSAPFTLSSGFPYLEVHHVLRLADGGPDTVENAVALCPNCHRRLHYSVDAENCRMRLLTTIHRLRDFRTSEST